MQWLQCFLSQRVMKRHTEPGALYVSCIFTNGRTEHLGSFVAHLFPRYRKLPTVSWVLCYCCTSCTFFSVLTCIASDSDCGCGTHRERSSVISPSQFSHTGIVWGVGAIWLMGETHIYSGIPVQAKRIYM